MSRAIELLVKMSDPKCVSVEAISRGESVLHKEQIIAAFAKAEREFPFGYHLLLVKYKQDPHSRSFTDAYVKRLITQKHGSEQAARALNYVIDMVTDCPLPSQQKRLKSLRNRYLRSQFWHIKTVERANKNALESGLALNDKEARQLRIAELNQVRKSTVCPRCRGTGEVGKVKKHQCQDCAGKGRLTAGMGDLIKSLGCSESEFQAHLQKLVTEFEQHCYVEMSNAENLIKNRLKNEILD